jgi:hypothetical protein
MCKFSSPFILEFVGVPGSGKSTISQLVVEALIDSRNCWFSEPTRVIGDLPFPYRLASKLPYAGYGATHELALMRWYASHANAVSLNTLLLFNWLFVRGVVEWNVSKKRAIALDQGLIQALWSVFLSESEHTVSFFRRRLLEVYPRTSSLIVCAEVLPQTANSRLASLVDNQSRVGTDRTASFDTNASWQAYQSTKQVVHELVDSRPRTRMMTLQNNNRGDLGGNVMSVVSEVKSQIQNS